MKETLTFRDLIQAQLDGDTVQHYSSAEKEWVDFLGILSIEVGRLDIVVNKDIYRIKPTKPSIDWSHVSDDYNYLVRNEYGRAILYKYKPELVRFGWYQYNDDCSNADSHKSYSPGNCDWKDSLVKRPEGV